MQNTTQRAEEILESVEKQAGMGAMYTLTDKHLQALMLLREQFRIEDVDLISQSIASNQRIDHTIRHQISSLHDKMALLIREVASKIESEKYQTAEEAINGMKLSMSQREKVSALIAADKKLHTSCQTLKIAIEAFSELNKLIFSRLENEGALDPSEEYKLVLGNALLVYELTDFSIRFIERFNIQGIQEIEAIHSDMKRTITSLRNEQNTLFKQAKSPDIEPFLREQVQADIQHRAESIALLEQEWVSYMDTVKILEGETGIVGKKLPSLRLIRDNAKAQINALAAVAVLKIVQNNIRAIEGAVLQLEQLQLASLSADRVKRLLGI